MTGLAVGRWGLLAGLLLGAVPGAGTDPDEHLRDFLPVALPDAAAGDWAFYEGQHRELETERAQPRKVYAVYRIARVAGDQLVIRADGGEVLGLLPEAVFEGSRRDGPPSSLLAGHSPARVSAARVEDATCTLGTERFACRQVTYEYVFSGGDRATVVGWLSPRIKASGIVAIRQTFRTRAGASVESTLELAGHGQGTKALWGQAPQDGPEDPL